MSIDSESNHAVANISIGDALGEAFSPLFLNLKTAFKFTILPSITMVLIIAGSLFFMPIPGGNALTMQPELTFGYFIGQIFISVLMLLVTFQFYSAWVRFIYKGESSIASTFIFNLKKRHFVLLGKGLLLGIGSYLAMILVMVLAAILSIFLTTGFEILDFQTGETSASGIFGLVLLIFPIILVLTILFSVIFLRFSYIFPAAALDKPYGFLASWKHTRKQSLRLFACFFILSIIVGIAIGVLFSVAAGVFSLFLFSSEGLFTTENPLEFLSSPAIIIPIIPIYVAVIMLSMVSYIPFINMHNYCFSTNTGWPDEEHIAERFS